MIYDKHQTVRSATCSNLNRDYLTGLAHPHDPDRPVSERWKQKKQQPLFTSKLYLFTLGLLSWRSGVVYVWWWICLLEVSFVRDWNARPLRRYRKLSLFPQVRCSLQAVLDPTPFPHIGSKTNHAEQLGIKQTRCYGLTSRTWWQRAPVLRSYVMEYITVESDL